MELAIPVSRPKEDVSVDPSKSKEPRPSAPLILLVCCAHLLVGPCLILVNKHLMTKVGFDFPMFVTGIGQFSSSVGTYLCFHVFQTSTLVHPELDSHIRRNMMLIGGAGAVACMYLPVTFIQILKFFAPGTIMIGLALFAAQFPTRRVVFSVIMICACTCLASSGEVHFNAIGVTFMVVAEIFEVINCTTQPLPVYHHTGLYQHLCPPRVSLGLVLLSRPLSATCS